MTSPPIQAIKDSYPISNDDKDVDKVDDDYFELTINTNVNTKTLQRSTHSASVTQLKPKDDKLL